MDTMNISYNDGQAVQALPQDVTGTGSNTAPVATASSPSVPMDDPGQVIVLAGTDANGNSLTYEIMTLPSNGSLNVGTGVLGGNSVTYTPTGSYSGPDSFTFRVNDGTIDSADATVSITVTP